MDIAYYFIGLLTGVSLAPFIGKELYKYYTIHYSAKEVGSNIEVK
jgi:hypothetical protein